MATVEEALARLDGVLSVSAGWLTDQAAVRMSGSLGLSDDEMKARMNAQLQHPFRVVELERKE